MDENTTFIYYYCLIDTIDIIVNVIFIFIIINIIFR